ncbi:MAG: hypothetical protein QG670_1375 [Thermoproteota archaeon]|nr:hypothetical protein [Thermoproteota archaeon]
MRSRSYLPFKIASGKKSKASDRTKDGLIEDLLIFLKKPRSKEDIKQSFPLTRKTEKILKNLEDMNIIFKRRFTLSGKGVKHRYNALALFGDLAFKTYYCRYDSADEFATLILTKRQLKGNNDLGFKRSLTSHLKNLLPRNVFTIVHAKILAQSRT